MKGRLQSQNDRPPRPCGERKKRGKDCLLGPVIFRIITSFWLEHLSREAKKIGDPEGKGWATFHRPAEIGLERGGAAKRPDLLPNCARGGP